MELPTKEQVVKTPKNETREATVTNVEVTTWRDHLGGDMTKLEKFDEPDQKIVVVSYETENGQEASDAFPYYEAPTDKSTIGKYLQKYGKFENGQKIVVYFNGEGYPNLKKALD